MDYIAYWIGYTIMAAAGLAVMLAIVWLAAEGFWRLWRAGMNMGDAMEAIVEWRKNHPDRHTRFKRRNFGNSNPDRGA